MAALICFDAFALLFLVDFFKGICGIRNQVARLRKGQAQKLKGVLAVPPLAVGTSDHN